MEINPVVLENLWRMRRWNFDLASMPNVHLVVDDGMHFVRASKETYSLIVNTVTSPLYFSSAKLYTRDFLEAVRRRLTPDGLYVTWIDSRVGDRGLDIILKTLGGSFTHCWLGALKSEYFLLVCSNEPIALRRPRLAADNPVLAESFFKQGGIPGGLPSDLYRGIYRTFLERSISRLSLDAWVCP